MMTKEGGEIVRHTKSWQHRRRAQNKFAWTFMKPKNEIESFRFK